MSLGKRSPGHTCAEAWRRGSQGAPGACPHPRAGLALLPAPRDKAGTGEPAGGAETLPFALRVLAGTAASFTSSQCQSPPATSVMVPGVGAEWRTRPGHTHSAMSVSERRQELVLGLSRSCFGAVPGVRMGPHAALCTRGLPAGERHCRVQAGTLSAGWDAR